LAVHFASTIILARMLTPEDYGLVAMVASLTALAGLFSNLGLSAASIQNHDLTDGQLTNLFWMNVGLGVILTGIVAGLAPVVAWFYSDSRLIPITLVMSISFLIRSFGTQHTAMLVREMQFGRNAIAAIIAAIGGFIAAVVLASYGYDYWSLIISSIVGACLSTVALSIMSPFSPGLPSRSHDVREMVRFGVHVTATDMVNYFHRNLDNILIGKFCGDAALGFYTRAYSLLLFPINRIRAPINAVVYPGLCALQDRPADVRDYFFRAMQVTASLTIPISVFAFAFSDTIISVTLGEQWLPASGIFSYLAFAGVFQATIGLVASLLNALGLVRKLFYCSLAVSTFYVAAFFIGIPGGAEGVAASYMVANLVVLIPYLYIVLPGTPVKPVDFFKAVGSPMLMSVAACLIVVFVFRTSVYRGVPLLLSEGMLFLLIYAAAMSIILAPLWIHRWTRIAPTS
tara:strand:- start:91012 stop:92382 length:1371 start_codon:yes stop_codon:yes gene_type:complete